MTVLAATAWPTNAELIADVARLGYLTQDGLTLDATYGRGVWWKTFRPTRLVTSDRYVPRAQMVADFTALPFADATFDQIAYDPPYVCVGGRQTTGIADMHDRFGLTNAPRTPAQLQTLINMGLLEMRRVAKPRAIVLVKCQDYISSGKLWPGVSRTQLAAWEYGLDLEDVLVHHGRVRPQPSGRRQVHARRNLSTLLVLRAPR